MTAPANDINRSPLLEVVGVSKSFGGLTALQDVSIEIATGKTVGLVGPNGAGKTTLFNCIFGVTRPDTGTVSFDGRDITDLAIHKRARLGIGRTFQRMELFTSMTVREHLVVAALARRDTGRLWKDLLHQGNPGSDQLAEVDETLRLLGLEDVRNAPVDTLSVGHGRLVELGRALMCHPRLLMLDEPSSGLDSGETEALIDTLESVRNDNELAVLLVEHDLEMVSELVDRLYVLDFGKLIAEGPTDQVLADAGVRKAYLGDAPSLPASPPPLPSPGIAPADDDALGDFSDG